MDKGMKNDYEVNSLIEAGTDNMTCTKQYYFI